MLSKIRQSEFVKNVAVLTSGTMIAQLLGVVLSPVILRFYGAEETAELSIFALIVSVGTAIGTARYEHALPLVKTDRESFRIYLFLLKLVAITAVVATLISTVPAFFETSIDGRLFYLLIPLGIFFLALHNSGTTWAIRTKAFKDITYSKLTNSVVSNGLKVLFGWLNFSYIGLIYSFIIGLFVSAFWFIRSFLSNKKAQNLTYRSKGNYALAKSYSEFPRVNLPHVLMDLTRDLLLAFFMVQLFSKEDYGYYDQSYKILRLPTIFIGASIGQVFYQKCAEKYNQKEDILPVLYKAIKILSLLTIVPFVVIYFFGTELFTFVYSDKWSKAGEYSEIMCLWTAVLFVTTSISSIPIIVRKQAHFFRLAVIGSIGIILSMVIPAYFFDANMYQTLMWMSSFQAVYFIYVIFKIVYFVKLAQKNRV